MSSTSLSRTGFPDGNGTGHEVSGETTGGSAVSSKPLATQLLALVCSCASLLASFRGLLPFDLPITHYMRSVTNQFDLVTIPWMALTSNTGDWIGKGTNLVSVSVVLVGVGWALSRPTLLKAGIDSAIAHGFVAVLSNGLKHLLGRPRPKFVHSGEWHIAPSMQSGWDSFPSGHTSATFAIAIVFMKHFPLLMPLWLGIAGFVGLSRVIRGAHFPTDVFGGAVLGVICGTIAVAPWGHWRTALAEGLRHAAIGAAVAFGLLWTLARPLDSGLIGTLLIGLGSCAVAAGLWLRRDRWLNSSRQQPFTQQQAKVSLALIAYGLACMTTDPLVVASAGLACLAVYLSAAGETTPHDRAPRRVLVWEGALAVAILASLSVLFGSRAVLPF